MRPRGALDTEIVVAVEHKVHVSVVGPPYYKTAEIVNEQVIDWWTRMHCCSIDPHWAGVLKSTVTFFGGSSWPFSSFRAWNICLFSSVLTQSSKNAKPTSSSERYQRWLPSFFATDFEMLGLMSEYWRRDFANEDCVTVCVAGRSAKKLPLACDDLAFENMIWYTDKLFVHVLSKASCMTVQRW